MKLTSNHSPKQSYPEVCLWIGRNTGSIYLRADSYNHRFTCVYASGKANPVGDIPKLGKIYEYDPTELDQVLEVYCGTVTLEQI